MTPATRPPGRPGRRALALLALALAMVLPGCAVVTVAGAAAGAAIAVTGAVVSTTVEVTGAVVKGTVEAVSGDDDDEDD